MAKWSRPSNILIFTYIINLMMRLYLKNKPMLLSVLLSTAITLMVAGCGGSDGSSGGNSETGADTDNTELDPMMIHDDCVMFYSETSSQLGPNNTVLTAPSNRCMGGQTFTTKQKAVSLTVHNLPAELQVGEEIKISATGITMYSVFDVTNVSDQPVCLVEANNFEFYDQSENLVTSYWTDSSYISAEVFYVPAADANTDTCIPANQTRKFTHRHSSREGQYFDQIATVEFSSLEHLSGFEYEAIDGLTPKSVQWNGKNLLTVHVDNDITEEITVTYPRFIFYDENDYFVMFTTPSINGVSTYENVEANTEFTLEADYVVTAFVASKVSVHTVWNYPDKWKPQSEFENLGSEELRNNQVNRLKSILTQ